VESPRDQLTLAIEAATGVALLSMHHDISTVTGEEVFVFRLAGRPQEVIGIGGVGGAPLQEMLPY
jgi:uncharacterized protein YbcI